MRTQLHIGLLAAVFMASVFSLSVQAQNDFKQGGRTWLKKQQTIRLHSLKTQEDVDALDSNAMIAMSCAKCKTVTVTYLKSVGKNKSILVPGTKHLCPGCETEITFTGHGKGKERVLKHSCQACGDESMFCCATKPGDGPTEGMKSNK